MEGLGGIYDIRPRRTESLVDWLIKALYRLEWRDLVFQDVEGDIAIPESCSNPVSIKGHIRDGGLGRVRPGIWKQNRSGIAYVWMADPPLPSVRLGF